MLKPSIIYGFLSALVFAVMNLLFWKFDLSLYLGVIPYLFYIIVFALLIISQVQARKILGGFIDFGDAFMVFAIGAAIGVLGNSITQYVLYNIIDPKAQDTLKELTIEQTLAMTEKMGSMFGVPMGDAINRDMLETVMADQPGQFEPSSLILSLIILLVMFAIGGLISSAIIKKTKPIEFD